MRVTAATTYVSATQLTICGVDSGHAAAGTIPVNGDQPLPGGGISNTVDFQVN